MNKRLVFPLIALASASVMSVALIANAPKIEEFNVSADATLDVNAEKLSATRLEDFEVPDNRKEPAVNKTDKKFKIELSEGRYILGALIFGDCDHQFVGSTLGDAFGLDNLEINGGNAVNFHLILSFEKVTSVTVDYHIDLEQNGEENKAKENPYFGIKCKTLSPKPTTDEEFYNLLTTSGYQNLLDNKNGGDGSFYNKVSGYNYDDDQIGPGETKVTSHTLTPSEQTNLLVIQFTQKGGELIGAKRKLSFTLTHLFFDHYCD